MKKGVSIFLLCILFFGSTGNIGYGKELVKTKNVIFPESTLANQTQTINIPNLLGIESISVDNGEVDYSVNGDSVEITVSNGTPIKVQTGGEYIPSDTKYIEGHTSPSYNQDGYVANNLEKYVYSGSYTTEQRKTQTESRTSSTNSFPNSITFNSGGFTGPLNKSGSSTVISGSPAASKFVSGIGNTSQGKQEIYKYNSSTKKWTYSHSVTIAPWITQTYNYNLDEFTGPLDAVYTSRSAITEFPVPANPVNGQTHIYKQYINYYKYEGNVSKPDTRVWKQIYSGTVVKPAVDTRVYRYRGNATKPAIDTRTYQTVYSYQVTFEYKDWSVDPNSIVLEGIPLDGVTQYFQIPNSALYQKDKNVTWGIWIKPKSLSDQTLVSNGDIELKIGNQKVYGILEINGEEVNLGFEASNLHLNKWNLLALSYDGNNAKLFFNNQLVAVKSITGSLQYDENLDIVIGKSPSSNASYFNGEISQFSIWDKALSNDEIALVSSGNFQNSGIGTWKFTSVTNRLSYDQSVNKNHAEGFYFSPLIVLSSQEVSDIGLTLKWSKHSQAISYELKRGKNILYEGNSDTYSDRPLVSDTDYRYTITPLSEKGEGVATSETFKTAPGSLELLQVPNNLTFAPMKLNGTTQKVSESFLNKVIIKDTRKERNGWKLQVIASPLISEDTFRLFPENTIKL
ncbi:LamG domain-containing protein [Robertmurraya yapensis]|uniref:LamG domain-containing protein n=1 Tax=Bacillus yapensis TaxID=2492960 RepID=A0A431VY93_9BACI|nr:LamG domain-containing protein [Bacillus yapensis]RTR28103.1 LamG domain-containing protein [Bacillus yapensis]TKS94345.1 LamG domain-containing protein [Bacillus yapensis]